MKRPILLAVLSLTLTQAPYAQTNVYHNKERKILPAAPRLEPVRLKVPQLNITATPPGQNRNPQKATALRERLIAMSRFVDNIKQDSFLHYYSNGRGSSTAMQSAGTYEVFCYVDTSIYYGKDYDGFLTAIPNQGLSYNSGNQVLRQTRYYDNGQPHETYKNTWAPDDSYLNHQTYKMAYALNGNNFSDNYYKATTFNADGYGLRDTAILDYSAHVPSGDSNFTWTSWLDIDAQGRPGFQRRQLATINDITIDSVWREYISVTSPSIAKERIKIDKTVLDGNITTTQTWVYVSHYNPAGLIDSFTTSIDGKDSLLTTYAYNGRNDITGFHDYAYANGSWEKVSKAEWLYTGDERSTYTTYKWDAINNQFTELEKFTIATSKPGIWDTAKKYTNGVLSSKAVSTFTDQNNLLTKTIYEYDKGQLAQTTNEYYYYELFEPATINTIETRLNVVLYPNPARNVLHVRIAEALTEDFELHISDVAGRVVWQQKIDAQDAAVPTTSLAPGMYLVKMTNKNNAKIFAGKMFKY